MVQVAALSHKMVYAQSPNGLAYPVSMDSVGLCEAGLYILSFNICGITIAFLADFTKTRMRA